MLPNDGGILQAATVLGQSTNLEGNPISENNDNPMINSRVYDVMFPDSFIQQYSANLIAQGIFELAGEDGYRYQLLDEIIEHRKN